MSTITTREVQGLVAVELDESHESFKAEVESRANPDALVTYTMMMNIMDGIAKSVLMALFDEQRYGDGIDLIDVFSRIDCEVEDTMSFIDGDSDEDQFSEDHPYWIALKQRARIIGLVKSEFNISKGKIEYPSMKEIFEQINFQLNRMRKVFWPPIKFDQ